MLNLKGQHANEGIQHLRALQALPLGAKVEMSRALVRDWYEAHDGNVHIANSMGMDSKVLGYIVHSVYSDVPDVFVNTGTEYPEFLATAKSMPTCVILRPKKPFHQVIAEHGWPIASKKIARGLAVMRNPEKRGTLTYRLYDEGINKHGKHVSGFKIPQQWRFLIEAPFPISDKCCDFLKKAPMHAYEKKTGSRPFIGTLACEGQERERAWLRTRCNAYDAKSPHSMPLSFWTKQDILRFVLENDLSAPAPYGRIIETENGLETTGVSRTGCNYCLFGIHREKGENRLQMLARTHPHLYDYVLNKLGARRVLQYVKDAAPQRLAKAIRWEPAYNYEQGILPC